MARQYRHRLAVLGGTFDHFHMGHEALLRAAFQTAERVGIGLTTQAYLRLHAKGEVSRIQLYARRRAVVAAFLRRRFPGRSWWIAPLNDRFGKSVTDLPDVLVVSEETRAGGRTVNAERRRRGLRPLPLRVVKLRRADDGRRISSTRIRAGQIDRFGHRRSPSRDHSPKGSSHRSRSPA